MSNIFKEITIKDVDWVAAGLVAIGLWALLFTLPCQITGGAVLSTQLVLTTAAVSATLWGLSGLVKWAKGVQDARQALGKRRQIIRDLIQSDKDILWLFRQRPSRTMSMGFNGRIGYLCDIGVMEWRNLGTEDGRELPQFRVTDDYWDLLLEEGWKVLYEGSEKPSNDPPENVKK